MSLQGATLVATKQSKRVGEMDCFIDLRLLAMTVVPLTKYLWVMVRMGIADQRTNYQHKLISRTGILLINEGLQR
jgi:hypothetical protein